MPSEFKKKMSEVIGAAEEGDRMSLSDSLASVQNELIQLCVKVDKAKPPEIVFEMTVVLSGTLAVLAELMDEFAEKVEKRLDGAEHSIASLIEADVDRELAKEED